MSFSVVYLINVVTEVSAFNLSSTLYFQFGSNLTFFDILQTVLTTHHPPPSHFHRHPLKLHTTSFSSPTYKSLNGLVPQYLSNLLHPHTQSRLPWSVSLPPQPPYFHGQSIHFGCPHPPSFTTCHWDFFCCYSSCYYNFYYYSLV